MQRCNVMSCGPDRLHYGVRTSLFREEKQGTTCL